MIILNRLKELRIEKGLLQADIAKIINKGERTVGFYETGERDMGTETLATLSDFFNVSIDYLLGKSEIRNPEELKNIPFANAGGLDTNGLDDDDLLELQRQIDYIKKMKNKGEK